MRRLPTLLLALLAIPACVEAPPLVPPAPPPPPVVSAAPPPVLPADPPPLTDGPVTAASVNGIQILIKRVPGAELAALHLYVKGGAREWSGSDAGIERLALATATSGGTEALDKDAFARKLAALGTDLGSEARGDFSAIKAKALSTAWDESFALLADTFLHPALPAAEFELQRQIQITSLRREQDSPDASLSLLIHKAMFAGHPLEHRAIGTLDSVPKLSPDAIKAHLARLRETSRLVFVTVGDVDPAHVIEKVRGAFGRLPRGTYVGAPFPALAFTSPTLVTVTRKLATNYIEGAFPAPAMKEPDYADAMVAMNYLHYRFFEEVRTKRNLSYAPAARLGGSTTVPIGYLYVTAVDPNTTVRVMFDEVKHLQEAAISNKALESTKSVFLTSFLMANETTDGQASMLAEAQILGGDWRIARNLPSLVQAVTTSKVQAFAKKYLGRLQTVVVGDPGKVDGALFKSL